MKDRKITIYEMRLIKQIAKVSKRIKKIVRGKDDN